MQYLLAVRMAGKMMYCNERGRFSEYLRPAVVYPDIESANAHRAEIVTSIPKWLANKYMVAIPYTTNDSENYYAWLEANNML